MGITVCVSSSDGAEASSSTQSFDLDRSTRLQQDINLDSGKISSYLQAEGGGKNRLTQSLSGSSYALTSDVDSQGTLSVSTSSSASGQAASIGQDVAGAGSLSLNLQSTEDGATAGQEASVAYGVLSSSQSLYAGEGQGAFAYQGTEMEGQGGKVVSGALGEKNVMLAEGGFSGQGSMKANLASAASERAFSSGSAAIDDILVLSDDSFNAVSQGGENQMMGMSGLRMVGDGSDLGSFDVSILNLGLTDAKGAAKVSKTTKTAAAATGGSYSSYKLTGYRWNVLNPKVQLYLNPTGTPTGLTSASSQSAIAAAANTWDNAVAGNIFADGTTVKVDSKKAVDNPFSKTPKRDGYNVNGWNKFGNSFIALNRWWTNGVKVGGYYSIIESDSWYNLDYQWTTSLATAQSTNKLDLQSVALHELGHCIGMGDIYSSTYGGSLPPSDPRTKDFEQAMNLYNGPQRTLGNGDRTGAQILYGNV
ncbi:MAG: M10 family metallopeptidase domain-containing protein [Methanothrix sp.]